MTSTQRIVDELVAEVPMGYLKNGDTALMVGGGQRILIIVAMDGHIVSPSYGLMYHPTRKLREKEYINIQFHAIKDQYRGGSDNPKRDTLHYNDTIYAEAEFRFLVDKKTSERVARDKRTFEKVSTSNENVLEIQRKIQQAQDDLAEAQRQLSAITK